MAKLCAALHLVRVTAPLVVDPSTGVNDNLNGVERPVRFDVPAVGKDAEVVHSWPSGSGWLCTPMSSCPAKGLVTDMNAIRRDEVVDNLHSIYVDQWDWEKVILEEDRTPGLSGGHSAAHRHRHLRHPGRSQSGYPQLEVELGRR